MESGGRQARPFGFRLRFVRVWGSIAVKIPPLARIARRTAEVDTACARSVSRSATPTCGHDRTQHRDAVACHAYLGESVLQCP